MATSSPKPEEPPKKIHRLFTYTDTDAPKLHYPTTSAEQCFSVMRSLQLASELCSELGTKIWPAQAYRYLENIREVEMIKTNLNNWGFKDIQIITTKTDYTIPRKQTVILHQLILSAPLDDEDVECDGMKKMVVQLRRGEHEQPLSDEMKSVLEKQAEMPFQVAKELVQLLTIQSNPSHVTKQFRRWAFADSVATILRDWGFTVVLEGVLSPFECNEAWIGKPLYKNNLGYSLYNVKVTNPAFCSIVDE